MGCLLRRGSSLKGSSLKGFFIGVPFKKGFSFNGVPLSGSPLKGSFEGSFKGCV